MRHVALLHSGGKDSVLALAALRSDPSVTVTALVATFTENDDRLAMHRIRRPLIEAQAASLRCNLEVVRVPHGASNDQYEKAMNRTLIRLRDAGVEALATGDLHLAPIRAYREAWLARLGVQPLFPLWGRPPAAIVHDFLAAGYRATVICIDHERLPVTSLGKELNQEWLDALPPGVDPCGEGGELHTFVHDGPGFAFPIPIAGQTLSSDGPFSFADLRLGPSSTCAQCGAPFACGAESRTLRCWCMAEPPVLLHEDQATCCCPRCLTQRKTASSAA
jgi:uncharacterized protein (TIGR00290 family)